jgi:carbon catabolite-derepressing protein kinase
MRSLHVEIGDEPVDLPTVFGSYEIVQVIGSGSFSVALLVSDRLHGRSYACKVVSRTSLIRSNTFHRFEQEIRLLEMIHHPNIVTVVDVIYHPNVVFVVMEYCSGGELFQYLVDHGRLREPQCREIFSAIVGAVSYLHSRGIAHRDLKPENILLTDQLVPKIADLGLCHLVTPDSLMMTPCGSPHYAAPEVLTGKGYDGRASDIWSLGVVLYVMATATTPWRSTNNANLFQEISKAKYAMPGFLTPPLKALIRRMMNPTATERPAIAEVAKDSWLTAEDDELGFAVPPPGFPKAMSFDLRASQKPMRKELAASGKGIIVRPGVLPSPRVNAAKAASPVPLDALLRKVPPSGRGKPPGLKKIPIT